MTTKYSSAILMPTYTLEAVIKRENGKFDFTKEELNNLVQELIKLNDGKKLFRPGDIIKVPLIAI